MTAPSRPLCPRCERPLRGCLCAWARPVANQVRLLILQHPQEAGHPKGSAPLLQLSLAQCQLQRGSQFEPAALAQWLGPPGHSLLLYPALAASLQAGLATPLPPPRQAPVQLVIIDSSWRKSLKLLLAHPALQALPRLALSTPPASRYRALRSAPRPESQRSTLEAACLALGQLEQAPERYAPLLAAFEGFVAATLARTAQPAAPAT